jgi:type IV secretion system protein TrbK
MSLRVLIALAVAVVIALGASNIVLRLIRPGVTTVVPPASSRLGEAQRGNRERFFGGNPDRDVRAGQEMKPRW